MNEFTGLNFCQNIASKTVADANCHYQSFGNLSIVFITNNFLRATQTPYAPWVSKTFLLSS